MLRVLEDTNKKVANLEVLVHERMEENNHLNDCLSQNKDFMEQQFSKIVKLTHQLNQLQYKAKMSVS